MFWWKVNDPGVKLQEFHSRGRMEIITVKKSVKTALIGKHVQWPSVSSLCLSSGTNPHFTNELKSSLARGSPLPSAIPSILSWTLLVAHLSYIYIDLWRSWVWDTTIHVYPSSQVVILDIIDMLSSGNGESQVRIFWEIHVGQKCQTNDPSSRSRGQVNPQKERGHQTKPYSTCTWQWHTLILNC